MRAEQSTDDGQLPTALADGDMSAMRTLCYRHAPWLEAAALVRPTSPAPGEAVGGGLAAVITALVIVSPVARWVDVFPVSAEAHWSRTVLLWTTALACVLLTLHATRDPLDG